MSKFEDCQSDRLCPSKTQVRDFLLTLAILMSLVPLAAWGRGEATPKSDATPTTQGCTIPWNGEVGPDVCKKVKGGYCAEYEDRKGKVKKFCGDTPMAAYGWLTLQENNDHLKEHKKPQAEAEHPQKCIEMPGKDGGVALSCECSACGKYEPEPPSDDVKKGNI